MLHRIPGSFKSGVSKAVVAGLLDKILGTTRGSIAIRGASGWTGLAPSATSGQVLKSNGTGADPSYGAGGTGDLAAANNLSDVANAVTARGNLYAAPFDALAYNGMQVNGSMDVSQFNGTSSVTLGTGSVGNYILDGVTMAKSGTSVIVAQQTTSVFDNFQNELKVTVSTAQPSIGSDNVTIGIPIEGYRFARAGWGTAAAVPVTVGFWLKSNLTGVVPINLYNSAFSVGASGSVTINASNTAQYVTVTFPAQTSGVWNKTNGVGGWLYIYLANSSGINFVSSTSNTFEMTGLIVLPGIELPHSDRAAFIMRPFDEELIRCKRYWQASYDYGSPPGTNTNASVLQGVCYATNAAAPQNYFTVPLRATPSFTLYSAIGTLSHWSIPGNTDTSSTVSVNGLGAKGFLSVVAASGGLTVGSTIYGHYVADSRF